MNNTMDLSTSEQLDRLSAFVDGELSDSEVEALLDCLDDEQCADLKSYQLIGDIMRDSSLAISPSDLFSVRLAKALEAEPAHSLELSEEGLQEVLATGTDGTSHMPVSSQTAQIHEISNKPKTRLAFVAGGVAAAFATILTYNIFQTTDIQSAIDSSAPVLASVEQEANFEATAESSPVLAARSVAPTPTQSFSHAPALAVSSAAPTVNSRVSTEERRRTYPEYLRSHSDMSAHTPFMQVNYQGQGVGQ
jgi:negative regulator of sigma E activity